MSHTCLQHIEEAWKLKTNASNKLFSAGKYNASLLGYEEALCRAEVLNQHLKKVMTIGIPFIQIFAISCHNIAFTYEKMGLPHKGEKMLQRVVYFLVFQHEKSKHNSREIQSELKRAMLNYNEFANRNALDVKNVKLVFEDIQKQLKIA